MGVSSSFETTPQADPVDASKMSGAWYVVESNLDAWRTRICPVVIYEPMEPSEKERAKAAASGVTPPTRVKDITEYRTGTLEKQSKSCGYFFGVDTQNRADPTIWQWKGTGMLFALTSDWQMVRHDAEYTWAIVIFGETTFTKAGCDFYYRSPVMPDEIRQHILDLVAADPFLAKRATGMFRTVQDPRGRDGR